MRSRRSETSSRNSKAGLDSNQLPDLPDDIIFDIFTDCIFSPNLTNKQAIQLGLSSKANFRRVQNRPALMFDGSDTKDLDYLHKTLLRYHKEDIHLETFTFNLLSSQPYFRQIGSQCLYLASNRNVKSLELSTVDNLILPDYIYKIESLVQLSLKGWTLNYPNGGIAWPNLKRMCLDSVNPAGSWILNGTMTNCPLLESLEINRYYWKKEGYKLAVSNHSNLKQLTIRFKYSSQFFELSATPNLESIACSYGDCIGNTGNPFRNLGQIGCQNLKALSLDYCHSELINDSFKANFFNKFPRLEELSTNTDPSLTKISVSSPSLKKIRLLNMTTLKVAHFNVPNIVRFEFRCCYYNRIVVNRGPKLSFIGNPNGWISQITIDSDEWRIKCGAKWCF